MDWCNRHVQAPTALYRLLHSTDTTILPLPPIVSTLPIPPCPPVTRGHKLTLRNVEQTYIETSFTILPQPSARSRDIWDINWIKITFHGNLRVRIRCSCCSLLLDSFGTNDQPWWSPLIVTEWPAYGHTFNRLDKTLSHQGELDAEFQNWIISWYSPLQ